MKSLRYVIVDVFTDRALAGNPLAVYTDARGLSSERMQELAREMNLSETVFVLPAQAGGSAKIRIFTPREELPFAGHPVLGTAFVLGGPMQSELVRLETGRGVIPVRLQREGANIVFGWMNQPIPTFQPFEHAELFGALGVPGSRLPLVEGENGPRYVLVTLDSADAVERLRPDFGRLARILPYAVSVSAPLDNGGGRAFKTRVFAPGTGILEDPATGAAAGPLGAHLARHGLAPFGETILFSQGAEIGRPSQLSVVVTGSPESIESVEVGGEAVIIARGEMRVP